MQDTLVALSCDRCHRAGEKGDIIGTTCGHPLPSRPFNPNAELRWDRVTQRFLEWDAETQDWIDPVVRERCLGTLMMDPIETARQAIPQILDDIKRIDTPEFRRQFSTGKLSEVSGFDWFLNG